ncbi:hypothetical protein D3C80_1339750 [compost metagenome]
MGPHLLQRIHGRAQPAVLLYTAAGSFGVRSGTQAKHHLSAFTRLQQHVDLHRRARVQPRARAPRQPCLVHAGRRLAIAIAPKELAAVAGNAVKGQVAIDKPHMPGKPLGIAIAGKQGAADRVDLADYMQGRLAAQIAQHPLDVAGQ